MSVRMKTHPIKIARVQWHGVYYAVPIDIIEKYRVKKNARQDTVSIEALFQDLIEEHTEPGLLLKGLRHKEGLSQIEFAQAMGMTQSNLSALENGRRAIGKEIAKRISERFGVDYRLFL